MTVIYGIANCSSVKKVRAWFDEHGIVYQFVDFKKSPPTAEQLQTWLVQFPLDVLLNKRGTTWRKLSPEQQAQAVDRDGAIALMLEYPSVIKRPIVQHGDNWAIGFTPEQYAQWLA